MPPGLGAPLARWACTKKWRRQRSEAREPFRLHCFGKVAWGGPEMTAQAERMHAQPRLDPCHFVSRLGRSAERLLCADTSKFVPKQPAISSASIPAPTAFPARPITGHAIGLIGLCEMIQSGLASLDFVDPVPCFLPSIQVRRTRVGTQQQPGPLVRLGGRVRSATYGVHAYEILGYYAAPGPISNLNSAAPGHRGALATMAEKTKTSQGAVA